MSIRWEINIDFEPVKARVDAAADGAVLHVMETLHAIVTPLVPKETGALAGSGDVGLGMLVGGEQGPQESPHSHVAHLYYPGPYALYQHQGVYFRRPAHFGRVLTHQDGQNYYLIQPVAANRELLIGQAGDEILQAVHY